MPRLDNSNPDNLYILREWGEPYWEDVQIDPSDPGLTPPMDVCNHCWAEHFREHDEGLVEHPLYDREGYRCAVCQDWLTADDDDPEAPRTPPAPPLPKFEGDDWEPPSLEKPEDVTQEIFDDLLHRLLVAQRERVDSVWSKQGELTAAANEAVAFHSSLLRQCCELLLEGVVIRKCFSCGSELTVSGDVSPALFLYCSTCVPSVGGSGVYLRPVEEE